VDFLAQHADLSKGRIKNAMNKGAVWLKKTKGKQVRIRRATTSLKTGDSLSLYYDEKLLALKPPTAECISDQKRYSVWVQTSRVNYPGHQLRGSLRAVARGGALF